MPNDDASWGPPWTVLKTLQWTTAYFKRYNIEHSRAGAEILLSHTLQCRRIDLYLRHDQPLHTIELSRLRQAIKRRLKREPVAYIVGEKEFWSLPFKVTPSVLIPRPETECLVERALGLLPEVGAEHSSDVLELGTGSGIISVALAHERPHCRYWATDLSFQAVALARENARRNLPGEAIHFWVGNWFDGLEDSAQRFDMVVSNPPYIRSAELDGLAPEISDFEPRLALDGGPDGLTSIAILIHNAPRFLRPGGMLLLELGFEQSEGVQAIGQSCDTYDRIEFFKDYSGHARVALLRKKER